MFADVAKSFQSPHQNPAMATEVPTKVVEIQKHLSEDDTSKKVGGTQIEAGKRHQRRFLICRRSDKRWTKK